MASHDSAAENPLEALLSGAVQALEQGGEPRLQQFLAAHPSEAHELRDGLERLRRLGILSPPPPIPLDRVQYGEFRILDKIGAGGMGIVYSAEQTSLQRTVALKVVRPEFLVAPSARERFQREVEAIARLNHPGIVPILAVGNDDARPWFAMEFVEGHTLEAMLAAMRSVDPARATGRSLGTAFGERASTAALSLFHGSYWEACVRIVHQVALAMCYVHERGVVHRDLKPSNVIVTPHGQAKVLDFGLAHVRDLHRVTRDAQPMGSPAYAAPEQLRGEATDERVDVYGLAVTLYELLTTQLPFRTSSVVAMQQRILEGVARPVRELNAAVPRDLEVVCSVAMDRDRAHRYRSMADFAADLEAVLQRRPIRARPLGPWLRLVRTAQRHPVWAIGAGAALLVLLQFPLVLWRQQMRASEALADANARLARANQDLTRSEDEARQNLAESVAAIEELLGCTTREYLVEVPRTEDLQVQLAERAFTLFESLRRRRPGNVEVEVRAATALGVFANELGNRGDVERAETMMQDAAARLQQWSGDDTLPQRTATIRHLGMLRMARGDLESAERLLREAVCDLELGLHRDASSVTLLRCHAMTMVDLGTVQAARGRYDTCLTAWGESLRRLDDVVVRMADEPMAAYDAAALRERLAQALQKADPNQAMQLCTAAIASMTTAAAVAPHVEVYRSLLASVHEVRGSLHSARDDWSAAFADHGIALALRSQLLADFPARVANRFYVGASFTNLAIASAMAGEFDEARSLATDAVVNLRDAARLDPKDPRFVGALCTALAWQIDALGRVGRHEEMGAGIREFAATTKDPEMVLAAARMALAEANRSAEAGGSAARDQAEGWRKQAIEWIERAVSAGAGTIEHFETGEQASFYDAIRETPRFKAALAKIAGR